MDASRNSAEAESDGESVGRMTPELKTAQVLEDSVVADECSRPLGMQVPRLLTVIEVAEVLGIGRSKVYELLYRGELK